jgi:thiamine pyrophosphate-dependent acetolactate synthase large subunit-like protein
MKLYEGLASALLAEARGPFFGLMGDGNISLWGTLGRAENVQIISARHEAAAVAMADGYFRATGKVGVATVTCGPGLTQVGTSLVVAARNRSSVVLIAGEIPATQDNKLQWIDQRRLAEAFGTRFQAVSSPSTAAEEIAQAFYAARIDRCPALLNLPMDISGAADPGCMGLRSIDSQRSDPGRHRQ